MPTFADFFYKEVPVITTDGDKLSAISQAHCNKLTKDNK